MQSAQPPAANAAMQTCAPRTRKEKRNHLIEYLFLGFYQVLELT
jgi:hypothetical protein